MPRDLTQKTAEDLRKLANSGEPGAVDARAELKSRREAASKEDKKSNERPRTPTGRR